jgi:hypothetical protein
MSCRAFAFAIASRSADGRYTGGFIGTLTWRIDHLAFL